jgi:hypothetical protein
MPLAQCDIDRSGRCAPMDILTEVDVLNGAEMFAVFNNQTIGTSSCPSE